MNLDKIKLDLVKLIKRKKNFTLVDIENYFNEIGFNYNGNYTICGYNENIIIWDNWNETASDIIQELQEDEFLLHIEYFKDNEISSKYPTLAYLHIAKLIKE